MSLVVVGSINQDLVAQVTRIPGPGETLLATGFARFGGGKGANQAVAAARAGRASVRFVGAVGRDDEGARLLAALEADGIDTSLVVEAVEPTGTALINVADDAENTIVVVPGANHALTELDERQREAVASADVVLMQLEVPMELMVDAAGAMREGAVLVLNAAPSADVPDALLSRVDVLVVNEHEAKDLSGQEELPAALEDLQGRVESLVVTLGSAGSEVWEAGERAAVPALPARAVDTTGAGDTFCGVLGARLAAGDDLRTAARWASAAAALAVQRAGAQESVPTADETEEALAGMAG